VFLLGTSAFGAEAAVIGPWEFFFLVQIGILILVGEGSVSYCSGSDSLP
jgi:hypothetical protein